MGKETSVYCCHMCQVRRPTRSLLKTCAYCRRVNYCSAECQRADWKDHRAYCAMRQEIEEDGSIPHKKKELNGYQRDLQELVVDALQCEKRGDKIGQAEAYCHMSTRYFILGHFGKAMELVTKSLAIALAEGDMDLQCSSYFGMGQIHRVLGQFDEALECHVKHLAIACDMGDKFEQGKAHCGMGAAYNFMGQSEKAIVSFQKYFAIEVGLDNKVGASAAFNGLANAYQKLGQYERCIPLYRNCC